MQNNADGVKVIDCYLVAVKLILVPLKASAGQSHTCHVI